MTCRAIFPIARRNTCPVRLVPAGKGVVRPLTAPRAPAPKIFLDCFMGRVVGRFASSSP